MNDRFRHKGLCCILLALYAAACTVRAPAIFEGRFWAEEGVYYALFSTFEIVKSLFYTGPGYPVFLTNAAVLLAGTAPIEYAPLVTTLIGFSAQLLLAALILFWHERIGIDLLSAAMVVAVLAVLPHAAEMTANSTMLQWTAAALSAIILIVRADGSMGRQIFSCCVLFVSGLTGAAPALLIPAFVLKWILYRSRPNLAQILSITVSSLIVMTVALMTANQMGQRTYPLDPDLYLSIISAQNAITEFAGFNTSVFISKWYIDAPDSSLALGVKIASVAMITAIFAVGMSFAATRRISLILFVAYWCSTLGGVFGALGPHNLIAPVGRYFFASNVMMLLLLGHLGARLMRPVMFVLFIWLVVVHSLPSAIPGIYFQGPSWRAQIPPGGIHEPTVVKIWPTGWSVTLAPR
jgi:hypothetical protein